MIIIALHIFVYTEKHFNDMMSAMITSQNWSLRPWKQIMEEQLNSWVLYIPGMASSKEVTDLKGMKGPNDPQFLLPSEF